MMKRIIASILSLSLCISMLPAQVFALETEALPEKLTLSDGYLQVEVSTVNGGFQTSTVEGNRFIKSDDNKLLLHNDSYFDTSFTSFRITKDGETKDYIFGREYGFLGMDTSMETVQISTSQIATTWTVDGVAITQLLTLLPQTSNQHGMVNIAYTVEADEQVQVEARIMLDTALGYQDYGYYMLPETGVGIPTQVNYESTYEKDGASFYDTAFYAYDDATLPTVTAYVVDGLKTVGEEEGTSFAPEKVSFGHWNSLASTVFDFTPTTDLNFTNVLNAKYMTADSAVALYYDLGDVTSGTATTFTTNYGVFSNVSHDLDSTLVMNFTTNSVPMELNTDKTGYVDSEFTIGANTQNTSGADIDKVLVVITAQDGLSVWNGTEYVTATVLEPYCEMLTPLGDLEAGEETASSFTFKAELTDRTKYRKIEIATYRTDQQTMDLSDTNLLSQEEIYVYCPTAVEPTVEFLTMEPEIIYYSGIRNITIAGTNFDLLADKTTYSVVVENDTKTYTVPATNINISENDNTLMLTLEDEMVPGTYEVKFTYGDNAPANANPLPSIAVGISDDAEYAPPNFGVITIENSGGDGNNSYYVLQGYLNEADFAENAGDVYMEFRGQFDVKYSNDAVPVITRVEGISLDKVDAAVSNVITINNCLDVENGSIILKAEYGTVTTDIDADVYTTGARTKVWSGVCAITTFATGIAYELTTYKINGDEITASSDIGSAVGVQLIWPGIASKAQTLLGLAFDFRYCDFALWEDDNNNDVRYVVSFGAKLDLGFLIPSASSSGAVTPLEQAHANLSSDNYTADELRFLQSAYGDDDSLDATTKGGAAGVYVNNILFGGEFIGFNADVEVGIPSYCEGLAEIGGVLHIAIMNQYYEFGVAGAMMLMDDMGFDAAISFKSYNMIPVPDAISLNLYAPSPGIRVDPYGIFAVKAVGGGVSKMYTTFFSGDLVPALTVNLMGQAVLFTMLEGQADLAVSARSVSLALSDVNIYDFIVVDRVAANFIWYPSVFLSGEVSVSALGFINGDAYIMCSQDAQLVEVFGSASVSIPSDIPLVGGMTIAHADMGISNERVWAVAQALTEGVGVVYYWGNEDIDIVTDVNSLPQPSYGVYAMAVPLDAIPVGYDQDTHQVLYADVSGSISLAAVPTITDDNSPSVMLMDATVETSLSSSTDKTTHTLVIGTQDNNTGALTLQFAAADLADATEKAQGVTVSVADETRTIIFFQNELDEDGNVIEENVTANEHANAKISFDNTVGMANMTIAFNDSTDYEKTITITTPVASDVLLYTIVKLPSIDTTAYTNNTVTWTGNNTEEFDSLILFAEDSQGTRYPVGYATTGNSITLDAPSTMPSGTYTLKLMASVENGYSTTVDVTNGSYTHTNSDQPTGLDTVSAGLGGNYTIQLSGLPTADTVDGYVVTITDEAGNLADYTSVEMTATADGTIRVGGQYEELAPSDVATISDDATEITYNLVTKGLVAGTTYQVTVAAYNELTDGSLVLSTPTTTNKVDMVAPVVPTFDVIYGSANVVETEIGYGDTPEDKISTITSSDVVLTVTASEAFTGTYEVVGVTETPDTFTGTISLNDLDDGVYQVKLSGYSGKDAVSDYFVFAIDATAPNLMLASPMAGGTFSEYGTVTLEGYAEKGSTLCVSVNGGTVQEFPLTEDSFSQELTNLPSQDVINLTLYAKDQVGNASLPFTIKLTNDGITKTAGSRSENTLETSYLGIFIGDDEYTNEPLVKSSDSNVAALSAKIVSINDTQIALTSAVTFSTDMVAGTASLEGDTLTYDNASRGVITASAYDGSLTASAYIASDTYALTVIDGTGSGSYGGGTQVTVTASKSGYTFSHWSCTNLVLESPNSATMTFTMPYQAVDLVANFTENTGGSGSTGGSSGSSGSSSSTTDGVVTLPATSTTADGISSASISQSTLTSALTSALAQNQAVLVIDQSTRTTTTQTQLTLTTDSVEEMVSRGLDTLVITSELGQMTLSQETLTQLADRATGDEIVITVDTQVALSSAQQDRVGEDQVVALSMTSGGQSIAGFGTETIEISLPYTLKEGEEADQIVVWAMDDQGYVTVMEPTYDPDTGMATFVTTDLAVYKVFHDTNPFVDVDVNGYYYDSMAWAVACGITTGTSETTFSPETICTRAEAVTFLYRAAGSPAVTGDSPFTDVDADAYYDDAVLWAVAQGVTNGTSATTFSPDQICSRSEIVTFLWNVAGKNETGDDTGFTDVADQLWYTQAVSWAVSQDITQGTGPDTFSPTADCTRGQIVTFLYRDMSN